MVVLEPRQIESVSSLVYVPVSLIWAVWTAFLHTEVKITELEEAVQQSLHVRPDRKEGQDMVLFQVLIVFTSWFVCASHSAMKMVGAHVVSVCNWRPGIS